MILKVLFVILWWLVLIYFVWLWLLHAIVVTCKLERMIHILSIFLFIFILLRFISLELQWNLLLIYFYILFSPLALLITYLVALPTLANWLLKWVCFPGYTITIWAAIALYEHVDNTLFLSITLICLYKFMWYHFSYPGSRYSRLPMLIKTLNRVILFLSINDFTLRVAAIVFFLFFLFVVLVYDFIVDPANVRDSSQDALWLSLFGFQCVVTVIVFFIWWTIHAPSIVLDEFVIEEEESVDDEPK